MRVYLFILIIFAAGVSAAFATEFTSTNFQVLDPVQFPGGFSSSANFRLFDAIAQISIGTSTSGSYEVRSGFLYFPEPTPISSPTATPSPTPTPTPVGGGIPGFGQPPIYKPPILLIPEAPPIPIKIAKCLNFAPADFNCDGTVDLADLSVFFYLSAYSPKENPADLNKNASIGLGDLSVMFYHWTEHKVFSLAKSVGLAYELPQEAEEKKPPSPAKAPRRSSGGFQQESGAVSEAFTLSASIKAIVVKAVDIIINLVSRIISFLW